MERINSLLLFTCLLAASTTFGQANNNPCVNAPLLTVGASCSNTTATIGGGATYSQNANNFGAPTCGGLGNEADVWYAFQAPASGEVNILTADGSITDAVMEVYSANCAGSYTSLGCNDDPLSGTMPELDITGLTPGNTYYIRLWEYSGGTGNFDICVTETNAGGGGGGSNDSDPCTNASPLSVNTTCVNSLVTIDPSDTYQSNAANFGTPSCGSVSAPDVWFSFVAPATGTVDITTATTDLSITDAVMEVYSSDCAGSYTSLGCNDDAGAGTMPALGLTGLTPGVTYYIRLWDLSGGAGNFDICIMEDTNTPCTQGGNNSTCGSADPFCTGNSYTYCNTTNQADAFPTNVPCPNVDEFGNTIADDLFSSPNPAFYFLEVQTAGDIHIHIEQEDNLGVLIDIDFAMWGPFTSAGNACSAIGIDESVNLVDCSYSGSGTEDANIFGAVPGEVYMLLMTNYANETGNFTFSQTAGGGATDCSIVLPVELGEFMAVANQRNVELNWNTQSEIENDFFSIERKSESGNFEEIGVIKGIGSSTSAVDYSFTDDAPLLNEINYYRLKQVDLNGDYAYSEIKLAKINLKTYTAFPNPSSGEFYIKLDGEKNITLQVVNLSGQVVKEQRNNDIETNASINCEDLEKGAYILRVLQNQDVLDQQIIILE